MRRRDCGASSPRWLAREEPGKAAGFRRSHEKKALGARAHDGGDDPSSQRAADFGGGRHFRRWLDPYRQFYWPDARPGSGKGMCWCRNWLAHSPARAISVIVMAESTSAGGRAAVGFVQLFFAVFSSVSARRARFQDSRIPGSLMTCMCAAARRGRLLAEARIFRARAPFRPMRPALFF